MAMVIIRRTTSGGRVTGDHGRITPLPLALARSGEGSRVELEPEDARQNPALMAFVAELRHWREVTGYSQKALAKLVGCTPSYVSKVERGTMLASRAFAHSADQHLRAGHALIRRWNEMHEALVELSGDKAGHEEPVSDETDAGHGAELVVEHEVAELTYGSCGTWGRSR
jgi:transcriptional regulator with XRE-family HTH domain